MAGAAELGALAVIGALALGLEPELVQAAGDRVDLEAKDGIAQECSTSAAVTWIFTILFTGTTMSLSVPSSLGCFSFVDIGVEGEAAAILDRRVLVGPVPGMADHLDDDVGLRIRELGAEQAERGDGDRHQDQHRDDRPGHFDHGVVRGLRGDRLAFALNLKIQ